MSTKKPGPGTFPMWDNRVVIKRKIFCWTWNVSISGVTDVVFSQFSLAMKALEDHGYKVYDIDTFPYRKDEIGQVTMVGTFKVKRHFLWRGEILATYVGEG